MALRIGKIFQQYGDLMQALRAKQGLPDSPRSRADARNGVGVRNPIEVANSVLPTLITDTGRIGTNLAKPNQ